MTHYRLIDSRPQTCPLPPKELYYTLLAVDPHGFQCGRQSVCFGAVSCGEQKDSGLVVVETTQSHDLTLAGQCRDCESVSHRLAKSGQMRNDTVEVLSSSKMPAEASDHFVEN